MYPETPTAENGEAIKELDAQEQPAVVSTAVVSRPASGRNSGKVSIDVHFALNFT